MENDNMKIAACRPYHAQTIGKNLIRMPDQKSVFKAYYLSRLGRDNPKRYDWLHSPLTQEVFEKAFLSGNHEGIGFFVTTFPYITKVFRFSHYLETILNSPEYHSENMRPRDISRQDGSHEFACYAEAIIAVEEYVA
jgi:hypothetical protein